MDSCENKLKILMKDYEILEQKFAEKSFKFLAINQTTKTIAKEESIPSLKTLILDMLFEVSLVKRGLCFEIKENKLTVNKTKNLYTDFEKDGIDLKGREEELELLNRVNLIEISKLNDKNILPEIFNEFEEGYCLTFMGHNKEYETMFIILGEKSFGSYTEVDEEFLITIRGQVEIILENAIKTALIENKNKELLEKNFNLTLINAFSSKLSKTLEIKSLYFYITELLSQYFKAESINIFSYDSDLDSFVNESEREKKIVFDNLNAECRKKVIYGEIDKKNVIGTKSDFYRDMHNILDSKVEGIPYIIPLVSNHTLLGIIAFKSPIDIEISLLETLRGQISMFLYNATLYTMAITDSMTKLYLQTYFKERLDQEIKNYENTEHDFSLIMMDIDKFKNFNDSYGHLAGDFVIKEVAKILKESVRNFDIVSRYGGEEFAVLLLSTKVQTALQVAERIRMNIEKNNFAYNGLELKVQISSGIASASDCGKDFDYNNIISKADQALYFSKRNGRNRVSVYREISKESL